MSIIGRKTKYKRKFCKFTIDFLAKGYSKMALAGELGINKDTLYAWCKANPEFSDSIKIGEAKSSLYWETLGKDGVRGKIKGFMPAVWIFTMKNRFGWKDITEVNSHTKETAPDGVKQEPPEEILKRIVAEYGEKRLIIAPTRTKVVS